MSKLAGVVNKPPIKSTIDLKPRLVIPAVGNEDFAIICIQPEKISNYLVAPVIQNSKNNPFQEIIRDGWDRVMKDVDFQNLKAGSKSIIVSSRENWNIYDGQISIIESAFIIDGAQYLRHLLRKGYRENIPIIILFNKSEEEELEIRRGIGNQASFRFHDIKKTVGTELPRLKIDTQWTYLRITSDPFVIKTAMGYAAAINVSEDRTGILHHLIVSPKSLTEDLEKIRITYGSLVGIRISVRKKSEEKNSLYELIIVR